MLLVSKQAGAIRWIPPMLFQAICDFIGVLGQTLLTLQRLRHDHREGLYLGLGLCRAKERAEHAQHNRRTQPAQQTSPRTLALHRRYSHAKVADPLAGAEA